jgi:glucose-1-phosphate thymidylyltransferase
LLGIDLLRKVDPALERAVLYLELVVRDAAGRMKAAPPPCDDERALVDDEAHVVGIDTGEVDHDPELRRPLGADDVDQRPEAPAQTGEAGPVPELGDHRFELALQALDVLSRCDGDSLAAVACLSVKGVVLAGGKGTRLDPLTRITNKHLLPIYDRPMVVYAIEALVHAGIDEIMLVTGGTHAGEFLRLLGNGHEYGVDRLLYAYQEQEGGIAEALALAAHFVEQEHCVVMLADNVFERSIRPTVEQFRTQEYGARILLSPEEDLEHLRHLGVPELSEGRIARIVEKPEDPPSQFAVTGVYFYDGAVWDIIAELEPSARGELEITDVNNWYVERGAMEHNTIEGFWGDAGESIDAYYAVNDFVRRNGANKP